MRVGVQTLKGQKHYIEVQETDTILGVKQRIESELKLGDANDLKLIYVGKILTNEQTVADAKLKANDMLVVMISKIKKAATPAPAAAAATPAAAAEAAPAAAAATPAPAAAAAATAVAGAPAAAAEPTPAATPAQPATATAPSTATPAATPAATSAAQPAAAPTSLQNSAASNVAMGSAYEDSIVNLMNLGFERQQCVDALRAAYNNADRAAEYLFGPESVLRAALAQAGPGGAPRAAAAAPTSPARAAQAPAQPSQQQQAAGGQAVPSADALVGMAGAAGVDAASLEQLRSVLQSNPALVPLLLQQVANGDPAMVQQLGNDPAALQALLQGLAQAGGARGGSGGGGGARRGQAIQITEQENQQLLNLQNLGFSRDVCVEAWLLCDRNEELAANYLFENGAAMMDEGGVSVDDEDDGGDQDGGDAHMQGDDDDDDGEDGPYYE